MPFKKDHNKEVERRYPKVQVRLSKEDAGLLDEIALLNGKKRGRLVKEIILAWLEERRERTTEV